ncbi:MAG: UbiD family decarboxylase, partial [Rhodospirillales bacterium]|nr:UbiD family decarboxylase [Rhodospirillales bacterium]
MQQYTPPKGKSGRSGDVLDRFRLRAFVKHLVEIDEVEVINEPVELAETSQHLHGLDKAVLFRQAGPEKAEIIANVMGSRKRLAAAFDTDEEGLIGVVMDRLAKTYPLTELSEGEAPVQEVIFEGEEADLTRLPVPYQHGFDGGPYISAALDYALDPQSGWTNIGARRLMIRGRHEAGIDMNTPSDLKAIYEGFFKQGKSMPLSFALGCHPTDHIAAAQRMAKDELSLLAGLRGQPLPVVKCITNDLLVPAD